MLRLERDIVGMMLIDVLLNEGLKKGCGHLRRKLQTNTLLKELLSRNGRIQTPYQRRQKP